MNRTFGRRPNAGYRVGLILIKGFALEQGLGERVELVAV